MWDVSGGDDCGGFYREGGCDRKFHWTAKILCLTHFVFHKVGDSGGAKWCDAWHASGAPAVFKDTWENARYDRILFRKERRCSAKLVTNSFKLTQKGESDHRGVICILRVPPQDGAGQILPPRGVALPLRRGLRARVDGQGVARRPSKNQACAKMELSTAHDASGPTYYCGKCFEKPRIPPGKAALIEDERRRDLWRLGLQRNSPYINGYMPLLALHLLANMDAQVVVTLKGAVDYVAKYISKYGTGQSVNARIGSLIDEIITKLPEGKKTTVCSVLSKAFINTSVPDCLCGLEAWHLMFDFGRVICSRGFVSLQADASKAQRQLAVPTSRTESGQHGEQLTMSMLKKLPPERYYQRFSGFRLADGMTLEWLIECPMAQFIGEVDMSRGGMLKRREKPKVVKVKPFLNLNMGAHNAGRMARMALRLYRSFEKEESDPWLIQSDEQALHEFEEFMRDTRCPAWLHARYLQHNRVRTRRTKHLEDCKAGNETAQSKDEGGEGGNSSNCDRQGPQTAVADGEVSDDAMEGSELPDKYQAHPPQGNNAGGRGVAKEGGVGQIKDGKQYR